MPPKDKVLIVPLDWGLGHATRCIPLIKELLKSDCDVIIAAEKAVKSLLQREFQQLTFIPIKGYRIRYSAQRRWLPVKIAAQLPSLLYAVYKEHNWLKKVVKKYAIRAVISDNRFGLYHSTIPSVYITHQLLVKTGSSFTERVVQKIHRWFIKQYTSCWVPDFEGNENIAGELSHLRRLPSNVKYIGGLSRFEKTDVKEKKYDLLILISGPEPQRTIFESMLLPQLKNYAGKVLLVRGLPGKEKEASFPEKMQSGYFTIKNHLTAGELNEAMQAAKLVISRSGYTTIMDLLKLQQKALLVPTPGQTEQEYLAWHLMKQDIFFASGQQNFSLEDVIRQTADFPFSIPAFDMEQYKKMVAEFVQSLRSSRSQKEAKAGSV